LRTGDSQREQHGAGDRDHAARAVLGGAAPASRALPHCARRRESRPLERRRDAVAGETAALVRDRFGTTPPHAVPNIPRLDHAARILLEHLLPDRRPDLTLVWLSKPDISFRWGA
jgi:hypothetical protein